MKRLGHILIALALTACAIAVTVIVPEWYASRSASWSGEDPLQPAAANRYAAAPDWPMFHGDPALSGVTSAGLPDKPVLLWTFKCGSQIKGSAAIAGGRVFFGSDDSNVYALRLQDGAKLWEFTTGSVVESTPCVVGGVLFVGSTDQYLYALEAKTGALCWRYATEGEIKAGPNFISGAALGLSQPCQPTLSPQEECFNKVSSPTQLLHGDPVWLGELTKMKHCLSQGRGELEGGRVLIGSYDNKLHCVDAATGEPVWTLDTGNYVNGCAAIAEGQTVFGACDGQLHIVDVKTGTETARVDAGAYISASPGLRDGVAYVGQSERDLLAVDIRKAAVVWRFENPHEFPFFSSPAVARDRLVIGAQDKRVHCLERATGKELWSFMTRGHVDSSPAIARDRVIAGSDDGRVYILALQDGRELWSYEIGSEVNGSPAVVDGLFIVGAGDGVLYAFGARK
ncbi:MAG: PQQ-binding-like beta-propeller repeat protein [Planctomycetota bacterium]